jgi:hypothetical protein
VSFAAELAAELQASVLLLHVLERLPNRLQLQDYLTALEQAPARSEGEIESVRIYFRVSDIAQSYEMLIARGVEFTSAPAQLDDFWSRNR